MVLQHKIKTNIPTRYTRWISLCVFSYSIFGYLLCQEEQHASQLITSCLERWFSKYVNITILNFFSKWHSAPLSQLSSKYFSTVRICFPLFHATVNRSTFSSYELLKMSLEVWGKYEGHCYLLVYDICFFWLTKKLSDYKVIPKVFVFFTVNN